MIAVCNFTVSLNYNLKMITFAWMTKVYSFILQWQLHFAVLQHPKTTTFHFRFPKKFTFINFQYLRLLRDSVAGLKWFFEELQFLSRQQFDNREQESVRRLSHTYSSSVTRFGKNRHFGKNNKVFGKIFNLLLVHFNLLLVHFYAAGQISIVTIAKILRIFGHIDKDCNG